MTSRVFQVTTRPTNPQVNNIGGVRVNGRTIGQPGTWLVQFEHPFTVGAPNRPLPPWLNVGVEIVVPEATDHVCWNCAAQLPAPGNRTRRQRQLEAGRLRVARPDDPGADPP